MTSQKTTKMTPMMEQYSEIKAANADSLLFYRMGDFYELFFEDAVIASQVLSITLTKRGKHLGEEIPMCGVPVHAADDYLQRLIRHGLRVAVCEQVEDPADARKRGAKSVVRRDVVRLVTPGTLTEDSLLDAQSNNFLTGIFRSNQNQEQEFTYDLASIDISTGEFNLSRARIGELSGELVRISPSEIITPDSQSDDKVLESAMGICGAAFMPLPAAYFSSLGGEQAMKSQFGVKYIEGFGDFTRAELAVIGGVLKYIELTQIGQKPVLNPPVWSSSETTLQIDSATRQNLELVRSLRGGKRGSLLHAIDRTITAAGGRKLTQRLSSPISSPAEIRQRLFAVGYLKDETDLRNALRSLLKEVPDIARALSRLQLGRGEPRDLGAIRAGLFTARDMLEAVNRISEVMGIPDELKRIKQSLESVDARLMDKLSSALAEELPAFKKDGGFVRSGYRDDLDASKLLRDENQKILARLQQKYVEQTGIKSLKVKNNNVLGYFVEVTATHSKLLLEDPLNQTFIHRQTLVSAVRFTTHELSKIETEILTAADKAVAIELEVFAELRELISGQETALAELARALAELDFYCALAQLADEQQYVCPEIDDTRTLEVKGGRHPVVEQSLEKSHNGPFIENDCQLGPADDTAARDQSERLWVVTGPNMAGKSTFLRQNALIVILAHIGSFVPAAQARIGVVDRLFSRVGASDDLARGRSTFMVEMVETAGILNQATDRSLVILDEIGRGTATFDGLSIAWATVEHLHEVNRCRALFATHYHELTALAEQLDHATNATIEVKEWNEEIIFLYKVIRGAADRSYGIQVAKLAGLPQPVISRATEVLRILEGTENNSSDALIEELPLFAASRPNSVVRLEQRSSKIEEMLNSIHPDELTPRQALDVIYKLKRLARDDDDHQKM